MKRLLLVVLLALLEPAAGEGELGGGEEGEGSFFHTSRHRRAAAPTMENKCSYTFIVPQQKVTGAICVNSRPEPVVESRANRQELEVVTVELLKQQRQIESLQQLVEVDGGVVNEVKLLRKESRNMNSRVTQLYMQLLHEIIRKRDNALEVSQLENKILNQTAEMMQLSNRYRDLEHKYQHLALLANNQTYLIAQLEARCQLLPVAKPVQPPPQKRKNHLITTNEIQRDQNPQDRRQLALNLLPTMPPLPSNMPTINTPSGKWTTRLCVVRALGQNV